MKKGNQQIIRIIIAIFFILNISFVSSYANVQEHSENTNTPKKFEPGPFITHHIQDAYEWHIFTYKDLHVTLPLPIILHSETSGWHFFSSSNFHHSQTGEYAGFHIAHEGENSGKIVEMVNGDEKQPLNFSITKNVLAIFVSITLLLWIFLTIAKRYQKHPDQAPTGFQNLLEPIIIFVRDDIAKGAIGRKHYERFMPFLLTVFFFILLNNLMGLIPILPGGANVTGNITVTMTLALFTFIITTINGNKAYWGHIINTPGVPWWLKIPIPLMPIVEIMGVFTKPFVLMIRLFANITAGHIIALGFFSLIFIFGNMSVYAGYGISVLSVAFTIFMTMLEFLVAFIQAYVFTLLSAIYFGMAVEEHH